MTELDSILSGNGAVAPASVAEEVKPQEQAKPVEAATSEGEDEGVDVAGQKMVPQQALHAEKQKVKRYTEQVADFDKRLAETNSQWERRFEKLLETVKPPAKEEKPASPDFWEDQDGYIAAKLSPVQQEIQAQKEQVSLLLAEEKHGTEAVQAAYAAFAALRQSDPQGSEADYQSIMRSRHPFNAIVDWHKKRQVADEIGNDPAAYREKLKAELLAEMQAKPADAAPATPSTPVMPSNLAGQRNVGARSGPAWSGPTPLNDIFDRSRPARA